MVNTHSGEYAFVRYRCHLCETLQHLSKIVLTNRQNQILDVINIMARSNGATTPKPGTPTGIWPSGVRITSVIGVKSHITRGGSHFTPSRAVIATTYNALKRGRLMPGSGCLMPHPGQKPRSEERRVGKELRNKRRAKLR